MWLSRNFPGLTPGRITAYEEWTPEQLLTLVEAGRTMLRREADERLAHTKAIAAAASGGRMRF